MHYLFKYFLSHRIIACVLCLLTCGKRVTAHRSSTSAIFWQSVALYKGCRQATLQRDQLVYQKKQKPLPPYIELAAASAMFLFLFDLVRHIDLGIQEDNSYYLGPDFKPQERLNTYSHAYISVYIIFLLTGLLVGIWYLLLCLQVDSLWLRLGIDGFFVLIACSSLCKLIRHPEKITSKVTTITNRYFKKV